MTTISDKQFPHWARPYNNYLYVVLKEDGKKSTFCHIDSAIDCFRHFGVKIYIKTKDLFPTTVLLAWK